MKNPSNTLAFPSHGTMGEVIQEGMTLRDYFAIHAPTPTSQDVELLLKYWNRPEIEKNKFLERVQRVLEAHSILRYKYADALLAEREKSAS